MSLPILQLSCRLFVWQNTVSSMSVRPLQPKFGSLRLLAFPKTKIAVEMEEICKYYGHTVHKRLSQGRLTADWLDPRESNCSRMHSKVSSDWLSSYIKATRPVLEIFKMAGCFPDSPRTVKCGIFNTFSVLLSNTLSILIHGQSTTFNVEEYGVFLKLYSEE
jgi:hypothetical protein